VPESILVSVYFAGAIFALFFASLLVRREKPDRRSNRFLAAFISIIGILLLDQRGLLTDGYAEINFLIGLAWPLTALLMPLLYLYAYTLAFKNKLKWYQYSHFVICVMYFILLLPFYFSSPDNKMAIIYGDLPYGYKLWQVPFVSMFMSGQMIFYTYFTVRLIRRHNKKLEDSLSNTSGINLNWIKSLFAGFLLTLLVSTFSGLGPEAFDRSQMIMHLLFIALTIFLAFKALQQQSVEGNFDPLNEDSQPQYHTSKLDSDTAIALKSQLEKVMAEQFLWKQENLKLDDLARAAGIKNHNLSQILNTCFKQNFYEFINSYRIKEYCEQIKQNPKLSTTELVFRIGFNSRTAFYRAFRRLNGMTPSEWRKSLN